MLITCLVGSKGTFQQVLMLNNLSFFYFKTEQNNKNPLPVVLYYKFFFIFAKLDHLLQWK